LITLAASCGKTEGDQNGTGGSGASGSGTNGSGTNGSGASGSGTSGSGGCDPADSLCGDVADCNADQPIQAGEATYYDFADGSGNCSFDPSPQDLMIGAMNHTDYAASAACGACVLLQGPNAEIKIRIVDRCPECPEGDIDLSPEAFSQIADLGAGRVPITWHYAPCDVTGPVVYHFKEGSNQWWTAVQIRNHRHPIATFEYKDDNGTYQAVTRLDYNYFVEDAGMGPGPYSFRVTDVYGNILEDSGIPFIEAGDSPGAAQFPACAMP
jgi:expansin (peptidoglycan-binding protein)